MKRSFAHIFALLLFSAFAPLLPAQVTLWSDDFNNGCAANCLANTWNGWTIQDNVGGTTGGAPNNWFVSCAEEGIAPPGCGSSCVGDASLHIGSDPGSGGDAGAGFNETGATNATFRRAVSPTISTVGYSTNTLAFDFIAFGSSACSDDRAQLHLSTDNGATWPAGFQYCLNSVCCGSCNGYSQGQWTTYTLALPAAFDNNPNVRIGYHWRNNGNGSGTNPSAAIDDIRITSPILPLNLIEFTAQNEGGEILIKWQTAQEVNVSHYELEKSEAGTKFTKIGTILPKGNGGGNINAYTFYDTRLTSANAFYRLKMIDKDGKVNYSSTVTVATAPAYGVRLSLNNLVQEKEGLQYRITSSADQIITAELYTTNGKLAAAQKNIRIHAGENSLGMDVADLPAGMYLFKVETPGTVITRKVIWSK